MGEALKAEYSKLRRTLRRAGAITALAAMALAGCETLMPGTAPAPVARAPDTTRESARDSTQSPPRQVAPVPGSGGYYLNDGPGDNPPANLDEIPDAIPRFEPLARGPMRPYTVMGQQYTPMTQLTRYKVRGTASWYGRRYHGLKTSSGETYDMYAMTAAHPVLPIPSYARVTNVATNKSVVVRINDRGPFHSDRLIDLSYTAAYKLGVLGGGKAVVDVETIMTDAGTPTAPTVAMAPAPAPPVATIAPTTTATAIALPQAPVAIPLPLEPPRNDPVATPPAAPAAAPIAAPAAAPVPAPPPVVAMIAEQKGLFLQLGAFGTRDNAEIYLARVRAQVEGIAGALQVYFKDGLFRVHAGPYLSQADARAAADRISQALGVKAMVITR